jgi:hypothetical protein
VENTPNGTRPRRLVKRRPGGGQHLIAYNVAPWVNMPLVPAPQGRDWMAATDRRFANRCLPMLIANQCGWLILNSHKVQAVWNGGVLPADIALTTLAGEGASPVSTHFGYGILTWTVPYLFRTPPDWNLWARGPANLPKDGVQALEGVVETDWSVATFTMNWKMTRPGHAVTFDVGEPVCLLVPQRRGELEAFHPYTVPISDDPELRARYEHWMQGRGEFNAALPDPESDAARRGWQKDYFQGRDPRGRRAPRHQSRLALRPFPGDGAAAPPESREPEGRGDAEGR